MLRLVAFVLILASAPLKAEVIDLSEHTTLQGAYLVPQAKAEFVTVQLLMQVGEADYDGPEGLAHYLEHLTWYSADRAHKGVAKNRIANAWVNNLFTNYWNSAELEKLPDMLAASARVFAPVDLNRDFARSERDVVVREYDLRTAGNPHGQLWYKMTKALIPGHGLSRSTIGTPDSLSQITFEMATSFKDVWYHPNNAILLITGPVDAQTVIPLLQDRLNDLVQSDVPAHPWLAPIEWDGRRVETILRHDKVVRPFFSILIKAPNPDGWSVEQTYRNADMFGRVLNGNVAGSLRKTLYFDDFTLSWVEVFSWADRSGMINFEIQGAPEDGVSMDDAIAATWAHLQRLDNIPKESFAQIHQSLVETHTRELTQAKFEKDVALKGILERGVPYSAADYLDQVKAVTLPQMNAVLAAVKDNGIAVTGMAYPKEDK